MIVLFAFDLEQAEKVTALMREKQKAKIRLVDAAMYSGEREDGDAVLLLGKGDEKHPKADLIRVHAKARVVAATGEPVEIAKAIAKAFATSEAPAPKADKPAKTGKSDPPAAPPLDPGEPKE